jgi:hypothetical protein
MNIPMISQISKKVEETDNKNIVLKRQVIHTASNSLLNSARGLPKPSHTASNSITKPLVNKRVEKTH